MQKCPKPGLQALLSKERLSTWSHEPDKTTGELNIRTMGSAEVNRTVAANCEFPPLLSSVRRRRHHVGYIFPTENQVSSCNQLHKIPHFQCYLSLNPNKLLLNFTVLTA